MTPSDIVARVAAARGVSVSNLRGHRRYASWARARQEVMFLLREETKMSLPEIGRFLNRDHSTVFHGLAVMDRLFEGEDGDGYFFELMGILSATSFAKALDTAADEETSEAA